MQNVRLGVIGVGNMGSAHAKNVFGGSVKKMTLAALCDISPEREKFCRAQYPDVPFFKTSGELIRSGLCDAVIIATPHYDHSRIAIDAFENGLNVITEKPAGVYTKQVIEMNDAAKKSGKLFGIMYNQRTNPVYQKIRKLILSGQLGALKRVTWIITDWYRPQSYHDSCTWRSTWKTEGGGALINQNPHQLDLWQWMFGMPDYITAHASFGKYYNIEVEDEVTAFLKYNNGLTGVYITSTGETPGTNRLEIACDMGQLIVENNKIIFKRNEISEREFNKTFTGVFGNPDVWNCEIPLQGAPGEQHIGILNDFTRALLTNTPLLAPGYDGIKGLTISNAMHYSAWTGETVDVNNFPHERFYEMLEEKIRNSKVVKAQRQVTANTEDTY